MHLVVIFHNIGGYHAARLRATQAACLKRGWRMTAVEITAGTREHPWGDLKQEITFPVRSLLAASANGSSPEGGEPASLVAKCLDELRPDAVAIPGWGFPESRTALRWCRRRAALALLMSESKHDDEHRRWWKEQIKSRLYVRRFDAALVGGDLHRRYLVRLGFPEKRIFLGYDVVDNDFFAAQAEIARRDEEATRRREPRLPPRPFFLAATRLIVRKNVARLIDAYAEYRRAAGGAEGWDLVICGSGVEEEALRRRIAERQLSDHVHLPGFVAYNQIGAWYGLASAFIHPAWQEQWGLVINEACAAGLPILCSRLAGAAHEIVREHRNGLLFEPHSTVEITQALLATHHMSAERRSEMGRASEEIIAHFNPQKFAEGLMNGIHAASSKGLPRAFLEVA